MIATLVATNNNWGAYVATQEMLERKEQPVFLSPYTQPTEVVKAIDKQFPDQFSGYTDYGSFWEQVVYAGIEKPDVMPHREPYTKEDWKKRRRRICLECGKDIRIDNITQQTQKRDARTKQETKDHESQSSLETGMATV